MESVWRSAVSFAATVIDASNYDVLEGNSSFESFVEFTIQVAQQTTIQYRSSYLHLEQLDQN